MENRSLLTKYEMRRFIAECITCTLFLVGAYILYCVVLPIVMSK